MVMCSPLAALVACALAQPPAAGTVAGTGSVELKRPPAVLRVQIELLAKGKDLKEALARLKDRREAARARLVALGAAADSVTFGDAGVTSEKTDRQRQMEQVLRAQRRPGGATPPKPKADPPAVVSVLLKADLPLPAAGPEELLVRATELQTQIKAADLGGLKEVEKPTPQEQELAEEMGMMMEGAEGEPKRGEPVFLYVAKIPAAERDKALAEAFVKARASAARLARAARAELGELHQLSEDDTPGSESEAMQEMARRSMTMYGPGAAGTGLADLKGGPDEAFGTQPGPVTLRVSVTAQFKLK